MPNYGVVQAGSPGGNNLTEIQSGDILALFNAETPTPPQASVAVAMGYVTDGGDCQIVFTISFASAPTDSLTIQGSHVDADAQYQDLFTSANKQLDYYVDLGGFAFYRAKLASRAAGGALTVLVRRG